MLKMWALGGLLASGLVGQPAVTVPPGTVTVDAVTVNGSSCRPGTAVIALAADKTAFTVSYSQYQAQVGAGSVPADAHKRCKLNVTVHVPQGYTYAVVEADYRGYAFLAAGASAVEQARYQFQGDAEKPLIAHAFAGPYDDDWQTSDVIDTGSLVYAPCGKNRTLNIDTELTMSAGTSDASTTSVVAMDSTDGSVGTTYHLAWKQCP